MSTSKRLRGLRALVSEIIENGSVAIEEVHKATAGRAFAVFEAIPPLTKPAALVHEVHDAWVGGVYAAIRGVNGVVGYALEAALDAAEEDGSSATHASAKAPLDPPPHP